MYINELSFFIYGLFKIKVFYIIADICQVSACDKAAGEEHRARAVLLRRPVKAKKVKKVRMPTHTVCQISDVSFSCNSVN